jgi:aerobic carbon-monoxide dehydrogenase medium subunit
MYSFSFHHTTNIQDSVSIKKENTNAKYIAGGQSLVGVMKLRLDQPSPLINLGLIPELTGISSEGNTLSIGAMSRHAEVAASPIVKNSIPGISQLAGQIADRMVRNMGTIGGSVANNDPSADYPAGLLGLNADIITNQREIKADDFFIGMFETALQPSELIQAIRFPRPIKSAYAKFKHPASRYAVVGVFVAQFPNEVRVAVTGAGASVFRLAAFEKALSENFSASAIENLKVPPDGLNSDIFADAHYRAHLITLMAMQAVNQAQ